MVPPLAEREMGELRAVFDRDFARLLALLADVQFLCGRHSYQSAAKVFAEFRMHQEQHLLKEERLLQKLEANGRVPTALVRKFIEEHVAVRDRIARTWEALSRNDRPAFEREIAALTEVIDRHERGEKEQLLPALGATELNAPVVANEVHRILDD